MDLEDTSEANQVRINIGIRISPTLKAKLSEEASELGQNLSEYGEAILHNRNAAKDQITKLKQMIGEKDKTIDELRLQMLAQKGKHQEELEKIKKEAAVQIKKMETKPAQPEIMRDKRLLYLFQQLKGKSDTVKNAYGTDFEIKYDRPESVLLALIYSSKLNK